MDADESVPRSQPRLHRYESRTKWRPRWFIAGPVVVLIVGALLGALTETASSATPTVPIGPGSATIHWKPVNASPGSFDQLPQPFTGIVDGISVSGVATMPLTTFTSPTNPAVIILELVNWEGTFRTQPFDVAVFVEYSNQATSGNPATYFPKITFFGAWGNEFVHGSVLRPSAAELRSGKGPLRFRGRVGDLTVVGKVKQPTGTRDEQTGSATFVVTR